MNKTKKFFAISALFALMFFVSSTAIAEESYLGEVSLGYTKYEDDGDYEYKLYDLTGKIHFSKVDTSGHPLAEAAFMERVGGVEFTLWDFESDAATYNREGNYFFIDASYLRPDFPFALYAKIGQGTSELKGKSAPYSEEEQDSTIYGLGLGWFIINGLEVGLNYEKWKYDDSDDPYDTENEITTLYTKFVHELSGQMAYNLEVSVAKMEYDFNRPYSPSTATYEEYSIGGDLYFTQKVSLGAGFTRNKGDFIGLEGDTKSLRFNIFITPKIAFGIGASRFDAENSVGDDDETFGTSLKVRF